MVRKTGAVFMYRKAVVKGTFYPDSPGAVSEFLDSISVSGKYNAKIAIVPHAGYIYSGETAIKTLKSIEEIKSTVVLLGPNHTGLGEKVAVYPGGSWQTVFGDVDINQQKADILINTSSLFKGDVLAHLQEHSLEVILPILKKIRHDISIVPITVSHLTKHECFSVAGDLLKIIDEDVTVVVSTDFNHFENEDVTNLKDKLAIDKVLDIDPEGLYDTVFENRISMCGVFPVTIALYLAKLMELKSAKLIEHTTSAKRSGDYNRVVGYAGILIG